MTLEEKALKTVSADNYFDLVNCIDEMEGEDLIKLIGCNGDYFMECATAELYNETNPEVIKAKADELRKEIGE